MRSRQCLPYLLACLLATSPFLAIAQERLKSVTPRDDDPRPPAEKARPPIAGTTGDHLVCTKCNGSGHQGASQKAGDPECPACQGCGYFKFDVCKPCQGSGQVTRYRIRKDGEQEGYQDECKSCGGHGVFIRQTRLGHPIPGRATGGDRVHKAYVSDCFIQDSRKALVLLCSGVTGSRGQALPVALLELNLNDGDQVVADGRAVTTVQEVQRWVGERTGISADVSYVNPGQPTARKVSLDGRLKGQ
jgi:hypothetical protein